jgi:6-phosphogluconolactonase (cycloisomerase 2 family)
MSDKLYVGLQDDDKIVVFALDGDSGKLTKRADVAAAGGPSVMAISPDRNTLYVGCRTRPSIASYRIDPTGSLSLLATAAQTDAPTFLTLDRTGRYMLCAYLPGRLCCGVSDRGGRHRWGRCHRQPENGGPGTCDRDRSVQPLRL